ncbi:hypothetical protein [Daejeonella lutea]|uniref:Uncharacterized protein n=1 Tax=Daejeonella lutea TaxID=572036 RepID=A0A1T5CUD0_9SPHI|nr:hypothetical protein [Daejeonella lutea]SKB62956.1 hypothetical protein SAMN05661099_1876 [Daejeonella lutea]
MKTNILKVSIFPLIVVAGLTLTEFQPGKENKGNGNKGPEQKGNQDRGQSNKGNSGSDNSGRGNQNWQGKADNGQPKGRSDQGNGRNDDQSDRGNGNEGKNKGNSQGRSDDNGKFDNDKGRGNDNKNMNANNGNGNNDNGKGANGKGKWRKENISWDRDENVLWGFDNYSSRKRPKDFKKVTVCHNTGDSNYPVTITVSENALKAHLNHGDQVGDCTVDYSDRWPANFIRTRENVYNNYQTTWETMSYSEALLRFAAEKLLGIKSTFQTQRATLAPDEIQRREMLIMDLQNNVNSLENQLAISRQRTAGLNININL